MKHKFQLTMSDQNGQFVVSAVKYRPQAFDEVVGQSAITIHSKNAIEQNHLRKLYYLRS